MLTDIYYSEMEVKVFVVKDLMVGWALGHAKI